MDTTEFDVDSSDRRVVEITDQVRSFVREIGGDGLLHLFLPHATAGLALMETGSRSEQDLVDTLERLLPRDDRYAHSHGSPGHGADHLVPVLVAPSLTLTVENGQLMLGTWQSVVVVDTNRDNARRRVRLTFLHAE